MKKRIFLLICLVAPLFGVYGQKIKQTGNLSPLKGEKVLNVQYVYDGLLVGKVDEPSYITKKVTEYNADEAGKGDKWKESWFNDRKTRYQPKFEELFNKHMEDAGIVVKDGASDAKFTLIVKTKVIEPGFNVGVVRKSAFINVAVDVVETANPSKPIAQFTIDNVPGGGAMGYDFDSGFRIAEGYAKLGKSLAGYIAKKIK